VRRIVVAAILAAIGAWFSVTLLQGRAENLGPIDPLTTGLVVIGGTVVAALPYVAARDRLAALATKWAEFWSIPLGLAVPIAHVSIAITATFLWDILMLSLLG